MFKHLFNKAAPERSLPSRFDELLKIYVQRYCLEQHIRLKVLMEKLERDIIFRVLESTNGNQRSAANMLGIKPNTLHYKIRRMGIVPVRNYALLDDLAGLASPSGKPEEPATKTSTSKPTED